MKEKKELSEDVKLIEDLKWCYRCEEHKHKIDFYKNRAMPDGLNNECKDCAKSRGKERYKQNKEKKIAKSKEWRHKHPEKMNAYHKKWADKNKEHLRQYAKIRRIKNPSYQEYDVKKAKEWRIKNPEKFKMSLLKSAYKRRAAKLNTEHRVTMDQLNKLIIQSENTCFWCDCDIPRGDINFDHIYPLSKGGQDNINNLVVSCARCNRRKSDKKPEDWLDEILEVKNGE